MTDIDDTRRALLDTGLAQYVDALIALREFRREVWHASRGVLSRYGPRLAEAVGGGQRFSDISEFTYPGPERSGWNGAWVTSRVKGLSFGSLYAGLIWYSPGSNPRRASAIAMFEFNAPLIQQARAAFEPLGATVHNNAEVHLAEPIPDHDSTTFEARLSSCLDKWIDAWTQVGGIAGLQGPST